MNALPENGHFATPPRALPGLQYFRGVAALLVVLFHAGNVFGPRAYFPDRGWESALLFGHSGVELFFVLSGFIICYIHWDKVNLSGELGSYARKRFARIYPPLVICVLTWAAVRTMTGSPLSGVEWFVSLTLIPTQFIYAPPVLWTLTFEVAFYLLFIVAFFNKRLFLALLILWGVSGYIICQMTEIGHADVINPLFGSGYTFLFGFGVATFFILRQWRFGKRTSQTMCVAALMLFAIAAYRDVGLQVSELKGVEMEIASRFLTPIFGLAAVLMLLALAHPGARLHGWCHKLMTFLGDASFSIYLWHLLGQRVASAAIGKMGWHTLEFRWLAVALLIASGLCLGSLIYWCVERPLMARLSPWARNSQRA